MDIVKYENLEYAPVSLLWRDKVDAVDVDAWWKRRGLPASRSKLERTLEALKVGSAIELTEKSFGLSLTDRYWVRPAGSTLTWGDVNFFDDDFTDRLGSITLDPMSSVKVPGISSIDLLSPNSTVGGDVPKKWIIDSSGKRVLVKTGGLPFDQDCIDEVIATELYRPVLDEGEFVPYSIIEIDSEGCDDRLYCACANMLGDNEELVTAYDLMKGGIEKSNECRYPQMLDCFKRTGLNPEYISECLSKMFSLDFLLANRDRHLGNFGVIRDCDTLRYKRFAPIFDSGNSLWAWRYDFRSAAAYDYTPRPFTGRPSESPQRQLRLFDDYRWFDPEPLYGWAESSIRLLSSFGRFGGERIEAIEAGVNRNIQELERHVDRMEKLYPEHSRSSSREGIDSLVVSATEAARSLGDVVSGPHSEKSAPRRPAAR